MKALVTGGAGFIGSHVVELLLERGHSVTVLDSLSTGRLENLKGVKGHPRLTFHRVDIAQEQRIDRYFHNMTYVFHLAALADIVPSIQKPADYYRSNVTGTFNVLEASRRAGVKRFVYAASSSCYGLATRFPTPETAPVRPQYPYALTKWLGEQTALHWGRVYGLPVVSLRLFNVYGPRSRTSGAYGAVFGVFLSQRLHGKPLTIVGDGSQRRDFVYVRDVAEAFYKAAASRVRQRVFNVGTGRPQTVSRLAALIGGPATYIPKRPGEPDSTQADARRIRRVLGWRPRTSFEDGVRIMLGQMSRWKDAPVWTPSSIRRATRDWFKYLG